MNLYNILNNPKIYNLSQLILSPGADKGIVREINNIVSLLTVGKNILDVGSGPESWLWKINLYPVGLDISSKYIEYFNNKSNIKGIVGSADKIPLKKDSFDSVWSIGLFHHLPDKVVYESLREMTRVCRRGGNIIIIDGVIPDKILKYFIPWILRKFDRGKFMRNENELMNLMPIKRIKFKKRTVYSHNGLEAIILIINC